jgi:hypothetical protein
MSAMEITFPMAGMTNALVLEGTNSHTCPENIGIMRSSRLSSNPAGHLPSGIKVTQQWPRPTRCLVTGSWFALSAPIAAQGRPFLPAARRFPSQDGG